MTATSRMSIDRLRVEDRERDGVGVRSLIMECFMPTDLTRVGLLQRLLGCDRLNDDWCDFYGVRNARSDALTARSTRKAGFSSDSFDNPSSETAITLYMLANTDGWKQLGVLARRPRIMGDKWNSAFFDALKNGEAEDMSGTPSLWRHHVGAGQLFGMDTVDFGKLILLFEVEVAGTAFRRIVGLEGTTLPLSFLDLAGLKKWAKFDALLIDPTNRWLYFIEAKLGSDLSLETEKYPLVNQAVRGLEAAYWLTRHSISAERPWKFRYVLICPRSLFRHRLRFYSHAFQSPTTVAAMLQDYQCLLEEHHRNDLRLGEGEFQTAYTDFSSVVPDAVRVVHWDGFAGVLADQRPGFWLDYLSRVEEAYAHARTPAEALRAVQAIRSRLTNADISLEPIRRDL